MNLDHNPYIEYANKEIYWLPMDTEKLYNENFRYRKKLLEQYNWIDSNFTYKFNKHGFRSDEFTDRPSILFLGCSITAGIGLPIETTWPTLVANNLNLGCYNLGIGGASNDTAFRLAYSWIERLKPQIVVFCQTYAERYELHSSSGIVSNIAKECGEFYNYWLSNKNNSLLNSVKNRLAINQLCNQFDTKFVHVDVNELDIVDKARDLAHPGIKSNLEFSKLVLSRII